MSLTLNPTITFNGIEAREAILEKVFFKHDFTQIHSVYSDIKAKEQIAFLERFFKVTLADSGCGTGKSTKELPMYEKFWNPVALKVWVQPCWNDIKASFFIWSMKNGYSRDDLNDTLFFTYLIDIMKDAMLEDIWRMAWFNDTAITDASSSPAGTLGSSSDIVYYNQFDGLWKQIFAGVAISAGTWGHIPKYTISENNESTEAAQLNLTAYKSMTIFKNMLKNADTRLRYAKDKVILCTDTLFQDYLDYKESKVLESSFSREEKEYMDGLVRGCTVIPIPLWDRVIGADFGNGTTLDLPHRAVLTTTQTLAVGFDAPEDSTYLDAWLDKDTEKFNVKGAYRMDTKILENYMFSVAY